MSRSDRQMHLRAALIAIGLYAAAALVWFVGPLLSVGGVAPLASEGARGIAIALVLAAFAAQALWRMQRGARRNRSLLDGLAAGADGAADAAAPGASEVALIGRRFADAMAVLRSRRVGARTTWSFLRRRPYVYELPWYILIGAPGAGKTTTIVNSGLHFPLAEAQGGAKAVAGVGGTRHCDWWFTDEAVLIDTAGRYTTQDSYREADSAAWNGFLAQLVQHRPRQPINGVILTLSVTDLLQPDAERRAALAREMRARIDELQRQLAIRFPIYLLVTKTDLLAGFAEFFADLDKDERAQVWGVTFPLEGEGDGAAHQTRLAGELTALEKTLNECLFERLRDEPDRERRAAAFGFPQQWRLLREALADMVQATFGAPAESGHALLRGVYFTSATQEGSPVDRALGGLARAMGLAHRVLPAARGSGRSYFVTRLLREVIIGEAALAGTNRQWEQRRTRLHALTVTISAVLALVVAAFAVHRYRDGSQWLAEARHDTQALLALSVPARGASGELAPMLPLLDAVSTLEQRARRDAAAGPGWASLGLDVRAPVAAVVQDVYHHLLREALLPRIAVRIEQRLTLQATDQAGTLYEALKAYLMLFGGRQFDAAALRAYLLADREGALPAPYRKPLREHLDRLLATGEVGAPAQADQALVARARERVAGVPLVERVAQRLRQGVDGAGRTVAPPGLDSVAGATASKLLVRASGTPLTEPVPTGLAARSDELPALVQQTLRQFEAEQPWVLGAARSEVLDDAARARLLAQLQARHRADVQQGWLELLADLRLQPAATLPALAEQAQLLARPDSPLLAIASAALRDIGPQAADDAMAALRSYAQGQPAGWVGVHAALGRAAAQLIALDDAITRKATLPGTDALHELAESLPQVPAPLRPPLQQWAAQAARQSLVLMREPLNRQLATEVLPACTGATENLYPFVRSATQPVTREAFARAFAPGGAFDTFQQRQLAGLTAGAARSGASRGAEPASGAASGAASAPVLSADALQAFQRAQSIRQAFFADGARTPGVKLQMRLLDLDAGLGQFLIDVDGQTLRFTRDARGPQLLQWPAGGTARLTLQALAPGAPPGAGYAFDGPWALLKLFERVRLEPGASPTQAVAVIDIEGRRARFELRGVAGAPLPFALDLEQFQCPKRL